MSRNVQSAAHIAGTATTASVLSSAATPVRPSSGLRSLLVLGASCLLSACLQEQAPAPASTSAPASDALVALGEALFQDGSLSANADHSGPGGQSCASCHSPASFDSEPDQSRPVSQGAVAGRFGSRNAPSLRYAAYVPALQATDDEGETLWLGGLFLDGRVDSLEQQAQQPFLQANEMNNASVAEVIDRLRASPNAVAFLEVFGSDALDPGKEAQAFDQLAAAIAAFERTPAFSPFRSRFDDYLAGRGRLTPEELEGMSLFVRPDKGNCAACHVMTRGPRGEAPLFTDFTYDNLGVPRNPDSAFFAADFVDEGLAATLAARGIDGSALRGKFRVPSLRNVEKTAPYMHNGVFSDLREVVEFYNTRDSQPQRWGATEVPATVNRDELGNLRLNDREVDAIVAFMKTLTDQ